MERAAFSCMTWSVYRILTNVAWPAGNHVHTLVKHKKVKMKGKKNAPKKFAATKTEPPLISVITSNTLLIHNILLNMSKLFGIFM